MMNSMEGVSIYALDCPHCGAAVPPVITKDLDNVDRLYLSGQNHPIAAVVLPRPAYVECEVGHRWTVETLHVSEGGADRVTLGDYLGGGPMP